MRLQSSTSETRVGRTEHPITPELKEILEALALKATSADRCFASATLSHCHRTRPAGDL